MALADLVFEGFADSRYEIWSTILDNPEKELSLEEDKHCRLSCSFLHKNYKCINCARIQRIARNETNFTVEAGENKGKSYTLQRNKISKMFNKSGGILCYDNFRGVVIISSLLEVIGLPTLDYPIYSFICSTNCSLYQNYQPVTVLDLPLLQQLLITLSLLSEYDFVFDELELYVTNEKVNMSYRELSVQSDRCLKIRFTSNVSMTFNDKRIVACSRLRSMILTCGGRGCERDMKHLGRTRYNIYNALLPHKHLMDEEVECMWKKFFSKHGYEESICAEEAQIETKVFAKFISLTQL